MPFTEAEFFEVFRLYNDAIWPLPVLAYLPGFVALFLLCAGTRAATLAIAFILAAMWAVNAVGYHWMFFSRVNPLATVFAAVFLLQSALLAALPLLDARFRFRLRRQAGSLLGLALAVFALAVYPLWGWAAGHVYPAVPVFGVAPCPTAIFTIGLLLCGTWRTARWLLPIPGLWAGIGGSAAVLLGVPQDLSLVAALVVLVFVAIARWRGAGAGGGDTPTA